MSWPPLNQWQTPPPASWGPKLSRSALAQNEVPDVQPLTPLPVVIGEESQSVPFLNGRGRSDGKQPTCSGSGQGRVDVVFCEKVNLS